ncbi:DnaJ domain-containing protein [Spirulina sp. CS-785/01]|uniref:J domain-containing protein n=1 Tax=Spirulina sp. CS-785/01 TaxID=3021716 RepID=UPI00232E727D|nr:J domain-containing protein [Spirulina sp. CS-785/01]MDB9315138.1 DnaJ domain-containing protein [Spirulina sp. CS-785/01]
MSFNIQRGLFKYDITDHYAILGLPVNADNSAIRKRYLKLARNLHPDTYRTESDADKEKANEILSKLVNPAYETLKGKGRGEYQIILEQTGKRLAGEGTTPPVEGEAAKALLKAGSNIDAAYQTILQKLTTNQYKSINKALDQIAQLSEVNLVYLLRKQGQGVRKAASSGAGASQSSSPSTPSSSRKPAAKSTSQNKPQSEPEQPQASPVDPYVRRANEYIGKNNFSKAILELRDGLKIDPNNSTCHGLMGLAYFKQKQVSMAKVHVKKALQSDANNETALKVKQALEKTTGESVGSKSTSSKSSSSSAKGKSGKSEKSSGGGMFGGLFGGKKK